MRAAAFFAAAVVIIGSCVSASAGDWWETVKVGGYIQSEFRYYPDAEGDEIDSEFAIRRARVKVAAKPAEGTEAEIQFECAGEIEMKDMWLQREFGANGESRIRFGQQNVPFSMETPQSSSSRLPLERNWISRRQVPGELDTGICYFWTSPEDHELYSVGKKKHLTEGDYGNFAIGVFNGQGLNEDEENSSKHILLRAEKPFLVKLGGNDEQYVQVGASYYGGKYVSMPGTANEAEFTDNTLNIFAYLAPQPFGLQVEYFDGETEGADLDGFYVMGIYRSEQIKGAIYARYDEMNGNRKGKQKDNTTDRVTVGYAHQCEDGKTRVTLEYSDDDLDDSQIAMRAMVKY